MYQNQGPTNTGYHTPAPKPKPPSGSANAVEHRVYPASSASHPTSYHPTTTTTHTATHYAYSSSVARIQQALHIHVDGIMGPQTHAAIVAFQQRHGLAPDGIVGPRTSAVMFGGGGSSSSGGSRSSSVSSKGTSTKAPAIDWQQMAANYGWSMSVLNSSPELKNVFTTAVKSGWTAQRFVAAIQNTNWYKQHGEAARQNFILQKADPATWNQRLSTKTADIVASARQFGASLTSGQARQMATDAMMFGWDTQQIQQHLAGYVSYSSNPKSPLSGMAGQAALDYKKTLGDYGLTVSDSTMSSWLRDTVSGLKDSAWVQNYAKQAAKSSYPALAQRIDAGETIASIAEPYKQSYAKILETDPQAINLSDPLIKSALQGKDDKNQPSVKSIWQFENDLRQDPRWMKTQNAQDATMNTARKVLNDFGFEKTN